uniref:ATP synthase subunit a n=1 Tax=Tetraphleps aterrimus TaxID=452413 RepID=A0A4D6P0S9_9HEMI|nr:ATP synthase F0 subunit 6 [Tetraphleps aterrimus]QCE31839.1 ATP synthase F0 subunit 6 [Tetraphleps aterrimus]
MMTNLFSTFDPSTSMMFSLNWMSTFMIVFMTPAMFWVTPSRYMMLMKIMLNKLHNEFKMLMGFNSKGLTLMFTSLFMFIMINNLFGLIPYIFTSSSHLTFTLALSLPMWIGLMMFGWINKTMSMLAHLIPVGTPPMLMPFMVVIETTSNLIRPGSLAVRLTANMIAGHLLMSLLGNNTNSSSKMVMWIFIAIQMLLMLFETAVSIIQAYVFSILSTLYTSEVA